MKKHIYTLQEIVDILAKSNSQYSEIYDVHAKADIYVDTTLSWT